MIQHVVAAIIARNGRILLTQRRGNQDFPFTWESPGGKVEYGESHYVALSREVHEELGINLVPPPPSEHRREPMTYVWEGEFKNEVTREDRRHIKVSFYMVEFTGDPVPREGQGMGWFTPGDLYRYHDTLAPANKAALEAIVSSIISLPVVL